MSSLVQKGAEGVGTTSVSIPVPAGAITAGNLLAIFATTYNSSTISAAGWAATDITPYLHMLLKTAAGGESAVTISLSGSPGATNGWMEEWSGVDTSSPIHGSIVTKENQTNASVTFNAYSTSAANISVVGLVAVSDNETVNSATYGNLAVPRGYAYENYDGTNDVAIGRLYGVQESAGSVGSPTMTLSASDTWDSAIFGWNNTPAGGSKVPAMDNAYRQRRAA